MPKIQYPGQLANQLKPVKTGSRPERYIGKQPRLRRTINPKTGNDPKENVNCETGENHLTCRSRFRSVPEGLLREGQREVQHGSTEDDECTRISYRNVDFEEKDLLTESCWGGRLKWEY